MIDIGGTPANILKNNKLILAKANNILTEEIVAILDPFDLARAERTLELGDYKTKAIKFPIEVPNGKTDLNSESVNPPSPKECKDLFEYAENAVLGKIQNIYGKRININKVKEKYELLKQTVEKLAGDSTNLREFMNGLIKILAPNLKTINLEEVLSRNVSVIYSILEKIDIPVRAICPSCNCFVQMYLRDKTSCCSYPADEIIKSGRYIPQEGFLSVIIYLCGYQTLSNNQEKIEQTTRIMGMIGKQGNPIITYKKCGNEKTMFESFLLGDENET